MIKRFMGSLLVCVFLLASTASWAYAEEDEVLDEAPAVVTVEGKLEMDRWEEEGEEFEMIFLTAAGDVIYEIDSESLDKARKLVGKKVRITGMATPVDGDFELVIDKIEAR